MTRVAFPALAPTLAVSVVVAVEPAAAAVHAVDLAAASALVSVATLPEEPATAAPAAASAASVPPTVPSAPQLASPSLAALVVADAPLVLGLLWPAAQHAVAPLGRPLAPGHSFAAPPAAPAPGHQSKRLDLPALLPRIALAQLERPPVQNQEVVYLWISVQLQLVLRLLSCEPPPSSSPPFPRGQLWTHQVS